MDSAAELVVRLAVIQCLGKRLAGLYVRPASRSLPPFLCLSISRWVVSDITRWTSRLVPDDKAQSPAFVAKRARLRPMKKHRPPINF